MDVVRGLLPLAGDLLLEQGPPRGEELLKGGERLDGHTLHIVERRVDEGDLLDLLQGLPHGLRPVGGRARHVRGQDVAVRAGGEVGAQHLLDHLLLPQVDVTLGEQPEERAQDPVRGGVVSPEERVRAAGEFGVHVLRVGMAGAGRRLREGEGTRDVLLRHGRGDPPRADPRRPLDQPTHHPHVGSLVKLGQHLVDQGAERGRVEGVESPLHHRPVAVAGPAPPARPALAGALPAHVETSGRLPASWDGSGRHGRSRGCGARPDPRVRGRREAPEGGAARPVDRRGGGEASGVRPPAGEGVEAGPDGRLVGEGEAEAGERGGDGLDLGAGAAAGRDEPGDEEGEGREVGRGRRRDGGGRPGCGAGRRGRGREPREGREERQERRNRLPDQRAEAGVRGVDPGAEEVEESAGSREEAGLVALPAGALARPEAGGELAGEDLGETVGRGAAVRGEGAAGGPRGTRGSGPRPAAGRR